MRDAKMSDGLRLLLMDEGGQPVMVYESKSELTRSGLSPADLTFQSKEIIFTGIDSPHCRWSLQQVSERDANAKNGNDNEENSKRHDLSIPF